MLFCLSLTFQSWRRVSFSFTEKNLLCGMVIALLLSGLGSSFANDWDDNAFRGLGVQLRYLAFIPIFLLLCTLPRASDYFWPGLVVGSILLLLHCSYELLMLGDTRADGPYKSPGLVGLLALIYSTLLLFAALNRRVSKVPQWLIFIGFLSAVISLVLSGSRSTFVTIILTSVIMLVSQKSARSRLVAVVLLGSFTLVLLTSEIGTIQISSAAGEVFLNVMGEARDGSVLQRLDMWAVSVSIFTEHPIWGVGWRNFASHAAAYVSSEARHPVLAASPHPHNAYLNAVVMGGIVGLISFALVLSVPYAVAFRWRFKSPEYSAMVRAFVLIIAVNSVNEGGTLIYNNTASIYFLLLAVLLALMLTGSCRSSPLTQRQQLLARDSSSTSPLVDSSGQSRS